MDKKHLRALCIFKAAYLDGQMDALFVLLSYCQSYKLNPPEWVLREIVKKWNRYYFGEVSGIGEAFEIPKHGTAEMNRLRQVDFRGEPWPVKYAVSQAIFQAKQDGIPVDDALFESVASELEMSGSSVKRIYYEGRRTNSEPSSTNGDDTSWSDFYKMTESELLEFAYSWDFSKSTEN